ncbi:Crp/Fnr family transcriptional regulator [Myroides fluvii]|uniref:Crp/Fnr family transcriptional regulator n=1 Tax=Myroides fluvii TaxID=2572594 RepID=UPI00131D8B0D|nr:Crp/Fnr family transcriptional regulator [Myroides fluvii]
MDIEQILTAIYPLPEPSLTALKGLCCELHLPKGHIILQADRIEHHIYFIKQGVVRAFSTHDEGEITFWFGEEGSTILSMKNYVEKQKSYENIELLVDCKLYQVNVNELSQHYLTDIHIANFGRKLAEKELMRVEKRIISRSLLSATERYKELITNYPTIIQRVPLKHIASYLGITQVSLSRIRKDVY